MFINKRWTKPKRQSRMDNPEILETLDKQETARRPVRQKKNKKNKNKNKETQKQKQKTKKMSKQTHQKLG
jgi:hypothetical protein